MSDKCEMRYTLEEVISDSQQAWKIKDLQTGELGFATYMTKERAEKALQNKNCS